MIQKRKIDCNCYDDDKENTEPESKLTKVGDKSNFQIINIYQFMVIVYLLQLQCQYLVHLLTTLQQWAEKLLQSTYVATGVWNEFKEAVSVHGTYNIESYYQFMSSNGVFGNNAELAALVTHGDSTYNAEKSSSGITHLHFDPEKNMTIF